VEWLPPIRGRERCEQNACVPSRGSSSALANLNRYSKVANIYAKKPKSCIWLLFRFLCTSSQNPMTLQP
jgi:hypothetical protein